MTAGVWDLVVLGGINTDSIARGPTLPAPGESAQGDAFQSGPGGKGANHAVAAARLGASVALIARVGTDDRGPALIAELAAEGIDTRHIARDPDAATGVALIHVGNAGETQSLSVPGANQRLSVAEVHAATATISQARVLLASLEVPVEAVAAAVHVARRAGARVVLDPAPPVPLPDDLLRSVDLIKPNGVEAETLTGIRPHDRASARQAAVRLLVRGVGAAAIQAGGGDNLIVWPGDECWLPAFPVRTVDVTGAGDAFAAALAVALAKGRTLHAAGPFASAAAALTTTSLGAQHGLPDRAAVLAFLARVRGTSHNTEAAPTGIAG